MNADLTIFFLVIVIYALIAGRLDRWLITMPIFFVVAGALLGDLLPGFQGDDQADVVSALVETERALRTAARLARRAAKLTA